MSQTEQTDSSFVYPERGMSAEGIARARVALLERLHTSDRRRNLRRRWLRMTAVTAAACLLVSAGFLAYRMQQSSVYAGIGEKIEKTLPDGSLIILNSDTRLRFHKDLGGKTGREVWMKGEAFFKVSRTNDEKPFIVHTEHFDVEVTGTQFNVSSGGDTSSILLTEGSVILHLPDGRTIRMKPGTYFSTHGRSAGAGGVQEEQPIPIEKPAAVLSWLDKNLVFEDSPLRDVAREIELLYRVQVCFSSDDVAARRITGILPNENLEILLRALEASTDFIIVKNNDTVTIQENP